MENSHKGNVKRKKKSSPTVEQEDIQDVTEEVAVKEENETVVDVADPKADIVSATEGEDKESISPPQNVAQIPINKNQVLNGAVAILQILTSSQKDNALFGDEPIPVFMQITSVKVPDVPKKICRLDLPHSLATDTSEICLIVPDAKKGSTVPSEQIKERYEALLREKNVTRIAEVIPFKQLREEYNQYEMKRRLCTQWDYVLVDRKISEHLGNFLGKEFFRKKKFPVPVKTSAADLKNHIDKQLSKTPFLLHGKGNGFTVTVAHNKHTATEVQENIISVCEQLTKHFPGGWDNIRCLSLKGPLSLSVPIYMTLKSRNEVSVPQLEPKISKGAEPVEDELSTIPGARVTVLPSGEVIVHKDNEEEDVDSDLDEILQKQEQHRAPRHARKGKKNKKLRKTSKAALNAGNNTGDNIEEQSNNKNEETDITPPKAKRLKKDASLPIQKSAVKHTPVPLIALNNSSDMILKSSGKAGNTGSAKKTPKRLNKIPFLATPRIKPSVVSCVSENKSE